MDSENRTISKFQSSSNSNNTSSRREYPSSSTVAAASDLQSFQNFQYTLADVNKLAEQAASMYAQNAAEKESYLKYYTEFYTNQIIAVCFYARIKI